MLPQLCMPIVPLWKGCCDCFPIGPLALGWVVGLLTWMQRGVAAGTFLWRDASGAVRSSCCMLDCHHSNEVGAEEMGDVCVCWMYGAVTFVLRLNLFCLILSKFGHLFS